MPDYGTSLHGERGKIRCTLTGHEVTPQLATVQAYWTGKKYRNAKARREYDYSQHEPYLVLPHLDKSGVFFASGLPQATTIH